MRRMNSKKAVSPLIAAVILIAIVVGLGAVILNVARNFMATSEADVELKQEQMRCATDVEIDFVPGVDGTLVSCDEGTFTFNLEAGSFADIAGIKVTGIGENIGEYEDSTVVEKASIQNYAITLDPAVTSIEQLKIVPKLAVQGRAEPLVCIDRALTVAVSCSAPAQTTTTTTTTTSAP